MAKQMNAWADKSGVQAVFLPDGRLHLNHGPIDLIIGANGDFGSVRAAFDRAMARFDGMLEALVAELPALRSAEDVPLMGDVARAMAAAVAAHRPAFITPMAAVAGAVADAVLAVMPGPGVSRAYVNNGGDIAVHLTPGARFSVAMGLSAERISIGYGDKVRGIATSGWRGRSFSFGIADAVTVLAGSAAEADAAATMIANAVDLPGHGAVTRRAACEMQADTDLGARLVTVAVGALSRAEVAAALDAGEVVAQSLILRGVIVGAALFLHPDVRIVGQMRDALAVEQEHCLG
ncbi:MAG: UPF0280 family protein [Paracoccaceae bacterium]